VFDLTCRQLADVLGVVDEVLQPHLVVEERSRAGDALELAAGVRQAVAPVAVAAPGRRQRAQPIQALQEDAQAVPFQELLNPAPATPPSTANIQYSQPLTFHHLVNDLSKRLPTSTVYEQQSYINVQ